MLKEDFICGLVFCLLRGGKEGRRGDIVLLCRDFEDLDLSALSYGTHPPAKGPGGKHYSNRHPTAYHHTSSSTIQYHYSSPKTPEPPRHINPIDHIPPHTLRAAD
ncbi:hypothetical protein L873DRAFT_1384255 [Choiromyces venosus 120613-1]|uniref:Uncharacterized protein n=1 Tax=Choiromyces venosus 120613-1 TaxID=1336337 RepID=A0A3N4JCJ8_9PEZI|nr:hypothetical protein L873DRAFT_1384255 [Choiromyces venosus 120613-1]